MSATTQPATPAKHGTTDASSIPGAAPERAKYHHRRVIVDASWRAARAWISAAHPTGLDAARPELVVKFPALAENIDALELVAQRKASTYENEPNATPSAFQAHLARWEAAALDGLAALNHAQLETSPGHQLDLPQLRKREVSNA
jgi:hypothetical protein